MKNKKSAPAVKASAILAYVAKHKKLYPLETLELDYDLPPEFGFDEADWCTITKRKFAETTFNMSPSQLTRFLQEGLSECLDASGRVIWHQGENWLKREKPDWWQRQLVREGERFCRRFPQYGIPADDDSDQGAE